MNRLKVRKSILELQKEYEKGNIKPLEDLMRAWKGIKELPADDPKSFFRIGGYHGEPFRGAGWGNPSYWGGYCNHGNILFPTWHRVYLLKLEEALQSIPGCEDVMLPYWDETSEESQCYGIPWALTQESFVLDGEEIPNPLRSFILNKGITDHLNPIPDANYSKPKGYETVRYPLSGLVGTDKDREATKKHNAQYPDYERNVDLLNANIKNWLKGEAFIDGDPRPFPDGGVTEQYKRCLDAPNYTVFSNTTSAMQWNDEHLDDIRFTRIVPLESPHNSIHLAIGGFDLPGQQSESPIAGANGDMGENDTAGLDPIFYFHHCFVDRVFWLWQKKHGCTNHLEVISEYPGTNSVDAQGPTPGTLPNSWLTLDSPLDPFKLTETDGKVRAYTSLDCINIETQLGYTYGAGSLETESEQQLADLHEGSRPKIVRVSGINRAPIRGSFLVSAYINHGGERYYIGTEAILSRWAVKYCANCQTHLEVKSFFELRDLDDQLLVGAENGEPNVEAEIHTRDGILDASSTPASYPLLSTSDRALFHVEVL